MTLVDLADEIASKRISPVEVTEHFLSRIDASQGKLNAFNLVTHDLALSQAKAAEKEITNNGYLGRLHGIPIAVKDIFDMSGLATTAGMAIHQNRIAKSDATVIDKLCAAGAVIVGKTNLTEGVYGEHRPPFGAPTNPWNEKFWPGASSSGSGVAVAAGLCAGALGSETGGSIRLPSAANGVSGLKPTWGRVSRHGVFELAATLDHVGPMARTARDAAVLLAAIAGWDINDPTSSTLPVPDYLVEADAKASKSGLKTFTIGIDMDWISESVDAMTLAAFESALDVMRELGVGFNDIKVPSVDEMIYDWFPICAVQTAVAHADTFPKHRDEYGPALESLLDIGNELSGVDYQRLIVKREIFAGKVTSLFQHVDAIAMPVLSFPTPSMDRMENIDEELIAGIHRFTCPFNLSRHPSVVLPCGQSQDKTPIVFQLMGSHFQEEVILQLGAAYQHNTDWHERHPSDYS